MSTVASDYAPTPEPEACTREECAQETLEQDESKKPPQIKEMEQRAKESARKQQDDIMDRDAHVPLCHFFRGKYGAEGDALPLRSSVKRDLMRAMAIAYPVFDFVMRLTLVEHYLDNPEDTPEELLARAPKNYFDEKNAKITVSNPQPPQPPVEYPVDLIKEEEEGEEEDEDKETSEEQESPTESEEEPRE